MGVSKPSQASSLAAEVVSNAQQLPALPKRDSASALLTERVQPFHSAVNVQSDVAQANWSTKHWLWIKDKEQGYISGWIKSQNGDEVVIQISDALERTVNINDTEKMNPPKFDKVEDMADLTYLNEASVVHNLRLRYFSNLIYTYSGEFCVAVNPYRNLPLYTDQVVQSYKGKRRLDGPPHIYAVAENAYWEMTQGNRQNQSILITGESGAGKTENTKKVIQYLTAIASSRSQESNLEKKILQANPILESFGNAQTVRNNNSSRFGKFIRIEFNASGIIAGANIERYLLEKSRVTHQTSKERSFHIFYQLLKGADADLKKKLLLDGSLNDYAYVKESKKDIEDVNDADDFKAVLESMKIMGFSEEEKMDLFKVIAVILHLGNIKPVADRDDQAQLPDTSVAQKVCHLLGINVDEFVKGLLKPEIKAGREVVQQARSCDQVVYSLEALARAFYERMFTGLVDRINEALVKPSTKTQFIGVLDIAGFEIFERNSFEQLCINYTNEKLQQFFNHHMFIKEQEEYERESIDWQFIDFGLDLQPTIELIENKQAPIGILSCLDEECVMPKATDRTFTEKLNTIWKGKSTKYEAPRMAGESFTVQHYAGKVEYTTSGWLDKNKDPLNENITRLLANSSDKYFATLFQDCAGSDEDLSVKQRLSSVVKKGAFRTVAQRHKEQLQSLMAQLHSTKANFVRCILPNSEKRAGKFETLLVLEQLRCNGVLEGIRISRAGFPSRLSFADFRKRYEVLAAGAIPSGFMDGRRASELILEKLNLDKNQYRVGTSKVFFRAGVLADLEERRDHRLSAVFTRVQALWRGYKARRNYTRRVQQLRAIRVIQRNARVYVQLREWPWWRLYSKIKPLLNVTRIDVELQKKEEELQALQEASRRGEEEAKRLAALKQTLESEKKQLEDRLISERNAAADQAELLQRSQGRITELQEAIEELQGAFEKATSQLEDYKRRCLQAEDDRQRLKSQLSELNLSLGKMEKDRQQREQQILTLQADLQVNLDQVTRLTNDKKSLEDEVAELRKSIESVTTHEADLSRQKTKLAAGFEELQEKLDHEQRNRNALEEKRAQLETELKEARDELADVERSRLEMENLLKRKETELSQLSEKLKSETSAKETLDRQRRELSLKVDALEADLESERTERQRALEQKRKLESELDEVHNLMQQKGDNETKQSELRALREQELLDTKNALTQLTQDLDDLRRKTSTEIDGLKVTIADGEQEISKLNQAKQALDRQVRELTEQLNTASEEKLRQDKSSRQVGTELHDAKQQIEALNHQLADAAATKSTLEAQLQALTAKLDESELKASKFEREKAIIQKQNAQLQEDLEVETKKSSATEEVRKRLQANLTELSQRLDDEEVKKAELQKILNSKTQEFDALKSKYETETVKRVHDAEDAKKKLELELNSLREQFVLMESSTANLEKTKQRLNAEIEDLKHEIEQEHAVSRQAEKNTKAAEAQIVQVQGLLDQERRLKEVAESQSRQLQAQIESLQQEMEVKAVAYSTLQRQKTDLEQELKQLIDEFGEGGKNVHELEKQVRRLQTELDDNSKQLEENNAEQVKLQETTRLLQQQLDEARIANDQALKAKDAQLDEIRRSLLKDINDMGTFLDEEKNAKAELLKHKKRLEGELADVVSKQDSSAKNKTELEKARRAAEASVKELQAKLDSEGRARKDLEDLARRQEQKANAATSQLEVLIGQVENLERDKRGLTKQVEVLKEEVEGSSEDSKVNLLAAKKTLERRVQDLVAQLEEAEELKQAAVDNAMATSQGNVDVEQVRKEIAQEYEARIEQVEDSKRALLVAQKLAQQELEDKSKDLANADKQRRLMQAEIDDLRHRLESETLAKSEEASSRRKLAADTKELHERVTLELAKNADLQQTVEGYKSKHQEMLVKLESVEIARLKAEKEAANAKIVQRQAVEDLTDARESQRQAEEKCRGLERQVQLMQESYEEARNELQTVNSVRLRQQQEVEIARDRALRELADREQTLESLRKKQQQELDQILGELELERASTVSIRDAKRNLEQQLEALSSQLNNDQRQSTIWKREKEKLEAKYNDLNRLYLETQKHADAQESQFDALQVKVRELQKAVDDQNSNKAQMDKMKKTLEQKLAEADDQLQQASRAKMAIEKAWSTLDKETADLRQQLEEAQKSADDWTQKAQQANSEAQNAQASLHQAQEQIAELERTKVTLERQVKDVTGRMVDLESTALSESVKGASRLQAQVDTLTQQLVDEGRVKVELQRNVRELDRQLRNLQFQLGERDKGELRLKEETEKMEAKLKKMKAEIDQLEANESNLILNRKKAEREAEEYRDKAQRLEKEIERLRSRLNSPVEAPAS